MKFSEVTEDYNFRACTSCFKGVPNLSPTLIDFTEVAGCSLISHLPGVDNVNFRCITLSNVKLNSAKPNIIFFIIICRITVAWWIWINIAIPSGEEVCLVCRNYTSLV